MGWVQQISLQFVGTEDSRLSAPPGNPKIWELLYEKVGSFVCRRRQSLLLEWDSQASARFLSGEKVSDAFSMKGLFEVKTSEENPFVVFQVKRKGKSGEPLVTLFEEWLNFQGLPTKPKVTFVREFVFSATDSKGLDTPLENSKVALWVQALESLAAMGAKSGIYFPESEEIRILKPGPWPTSPSEWVIPQSPELFQKYIVQSLREGVWSYMRRSYKVGLHKPRSKTAYQIKTPRIFDKIHQVQEHVILLDERLDGTMGPLNLLVSHPIRTDGYSNLEKFRYRCESYASLVDAPLGATVFRTPSPGPLMIEPLNALPVKTDSLQRIYKDHIQGNSHAKLALVSLVGFDIRNPLSWRRTQQFFERISKNKKHKLSEKTEIWEGGQNWLALLFQYARSLNVKGFQIDVAAGFGRWLATNEQKCRFHRAIVFWVESQNLQEIKSKISSLGLEIAVLGEPTEILDGVKIINRETTLLSQKWTDLGADLNIYLRPNELSFHEQDLKSPTYGFDRPAHFPDEYMVKASVRDALEPKWNQELHRVYSGKDYRSVLVRGQGSLVIPAYRWADGSKIIAESWGTREGWLDVNPFESGRSSVDSAVRWIVAMGAEPTECLAHIWSPLPDDFEMAGNSADETKAQTILALEGVLDACEAFQLCPKQGNFEGVSNPLMKNEIFVGLRKELPSKGVVTFPGFRMLGEVLFMVGPKPAFMDGGSRVLNHISRVFSNHVSVLDYANQIELYRLVHNYLLKGVITCIRPINEAGLISTIGEMALWGGMGAQIRPTVSTIELFSGSPGRFLVGVLPQEAKKFEASFKSEQIVQVGTTGGEKIFGLPIQKLQESRLKGEAL